MATTRVRYIGPPGQTSTEIAQATDGPAELEPGKEYTLPAALAKALLAHDAKFAPVGKSTAGKKTGAASRRRGKKRGTSADPDQKTAADLPSTSSDVQETGG